MPFTPFHLALIPPMKLLYKEKFQIAPFVVAQVLMDLEPGLKMLGGFPGDIHNWTHQPGAAIGLGVVVGVWFWQSRRWLGLASALFGTLSHMILDALVHTDVRPLAPYLNTNPFYTGEFHTVEIGLVVVGFAAAIALWLKSRREPPKPEQE